MVYVFAIVYVATYGVGALIAHDWALGKIRIEELEGRKVTTDHNTIAKFFALFWIFTPVIAHIFAPQNTGKQK